MMLDDVDRHILTVLQGNGRVSNAELARRVGLTPTPCLRRVRRLERAGVIRGYRAVVAPQVDGRGLRALVAVRLARHSRQEVQRFEQQVAELPAVDAAFHVTGNDDYVLLVSVADLAGYEQFHAEQLTGLAGVVQVTTSIVMNELPLAR